MGERSSAMMMKVRGVSVVFVTQKYKRTENEFPQRNTNDRGTSKLDISFGILEGARQARGLWIVDRGSIRPERSETVLSRLKESNPST